jgi:hypothetical protein
VQSSRVQEAISVLKASLENAEVKKKEVPKPEPKKLKKVNAKVKRSR